MTAAADSSSGGANRPTSRVGLTNSSYMRLETPNLQHAGVQGEQLGCYGLHACA